MSMIGYAVIMLAAVALFAVGVAAICRVQKKHNGGVF